MENTKANIKTTKKVPETKGAIKGVPVNDDANIIKNKFDIKHLLLSKQEVLTREEREKRRAARRKKFIIISIILIIAFFAAGILVHYLWPNSDIAQITEDGVLSVLNIANWFTDNITTILQTISTIILVYIISLIVNFILSLMGRGSKRRKTVMSLVSSAVTFITYLVILTVILTFCGVNLTAIFAGAGVIGIIIGLGAQSVVSDIFAGVFLIVENGFAVGDIITIPSENFRGEVEEIGVRTTKLRDSFSNVLIINNSAFKSVVNMSRNQSFVACNITINYDEDLEKVERIITANLEKIGANIKTLTAPVVYNKIQEFSERGIVLRVSSYCNEGDIYQTQRDLNREMKRLFDKTNIKLAIPHIEVVKK
ncbi:MAG: mechanosensitive ion channel family protein [Christensenellaceae bacterium]|jgi:small conductance mechanosensitive channel|nr:mechanosensitive ion channel family protein [Christensenellaceae bacterium]